MNKKPNIIFLLNDHQAYYRHGWDGGAKPLRPNFDRIAKEGIEFTNAYSVSPLCGPSRRSMITGLLPHQHKQYHNYTDSKYDHEVYLNNLADVGYDNYYYGKWHAGPGSAHNFNIKDGFSYTSYGNPYITPEYKEYLERYNLPKAQHKIEKVFRVADMVEKKMFPGLEEGALYSCEDEWCGEHAVGITTTPKESHESFFLATLACEKLEEIAKADDGKPFALRVDFWGPHQPFFPTQEFCDLYDEEDIQVYGSLNSDLATKPEMYRVERNQPLGKDGKLVIPNPLPVSEWKKMLLRCYAHGTLVDAAGGLIIEKLEELGLDDNTVIIWSTDHGDALGSHGGHFDKFSYMSEEVTRIPMAMSWKGNIESGKKSDAYVSNMDIPTTILDLAGTKFNNEVAGKSLADIAVRGKEKVRDYGFSQSYGHGYGHEITSRMVVKDDYKYIATIEEMHELYNLKEDPYELENLAYNDSYKDMLKVMQEYLKQFQTEYDDDVKVIESY